MIRDPSHGPPYARNCSRQGGDEGRGFSAAESLSGLLLPDGPSRPWACLVGTPTSGRGGAKVGGLQEGAEGRLFALLDASAPALLRFVP